MVASPARYPAWSAARLALSPMNVGSNGVSRSQTGFTPQFEVALPPTNNPTTATGAANALGSHLAIAIPIRTNSPATSGP